MSGQSKKSSSNALRASHDSTLRVVQRAELADRLGAPQTATYAQFGLLIHRSPRTVARFVRRGLPVVVPGVIDVAAAIEWLKLRGVKGRQQQRGRPRNVDRGLTYNRDGGAR